MSRLFDADYNLPEYRAHLGRLLGFFETLERAVACAADPSDPVRALERSIALRQDLTVMGATPSQIDALERCLWVSPIDSRGLYGYFYVILGSMMGGKIIVKQLRSTLGASASFHFYGCGTERSGALWKSFCSDLEENGKYNVDTICATAVRIFDEYAAWLSQSALQPGDI